MNFAPRCSHCSCFCWAPWLRRLPRNMPDISGCSHLEVCCSAVLCPPAMKWVAEVDWRPASRLQRLGWRQGVLDLRAGGRRRGLCLRLRVDRAHHLHVDARVSRACGEPVRPADLALRLSGQHFGWVLGLRDRAYRLRLVLHLDVAHRHSGRIVGGLCMVPRRDIGRGADPGRGTALERFE